MRVIFLDFDGVLNNAFTFTKKDSKGRFLSLRSAIEPLFVKRVAKIQKETGAKIVISSAWRYGKNVEWFQNKLGSFGIEPKSIIGMTDTFASLDDRWIEIGKWLIEHPKVESFVILDDIEYMGPLFPCHVCTLWEVGLDKEGMNEAIKILNDNWWDRILEGKVA